MPRPKRRRRVGFEPNITLYKPVGVRKRNIEYVELSVDELEALRLKNLEEKDQKESAEEMDVSQPTFSRLVTSARKKVTEALVNGKAIKIEGGNYQFVGGRGKGKGRRFSNPPTHCVCPNCGNEQEKERGIPCTQVECKECGSKMIRGD
ncbi:MAG: DUF134 domain-containing protein [Candidatus Aenigmatarchaeota archaeon]